MKNRVKNLIPLELYKEKTPNTPSVKVNIEEISNFIYLMDEHFSPPISMRVDIPDYASKLIKKARLFGFKVDEQLSALIAFYCNDVVTKNAYISYLAVSPACTGRGIASKLLETCFEKCIEENMQAIYVKTEFNNRKAIKLYEKSGFTRVEEITTTVRHSLLLKKQLNSHLLQGVR